MSAPTSRPVHPCVVTTTDGCRGCEFSTWARLISPNSSVRSDTQLVTASANTIAVYSVLAAGTKLKNLYCHYQFGNLAGNVVHLSTLKGFDSDAILVGFAGQARLTVVTLEQGLLRAQALLDLHPAWEANAFGATSFEDIIVSTVMVSPGHAVIACVLGGGTALCCAPVQFSKKHQAWMIEQEPYVIPLASLSKSLPHVDPPEVAQQFSLCTGFGQIIDVVFWPGYLEPVVILLHSGVNGRVNTGRVGREVEDGEEDPGAPPLYCSALSVAVGHHRTALLWSSEVPTDAQYMVCSSTSGGATSGPSETSLFAVGVNSITILRPGGRSQQVIATNGWARTTCPATLQPKLQANSILKLAVSLEDCRLCWTSQESALLSLRSGQLYVLQLVSGVWTLWPTGQTVGGVGQVEHLNSHTTGENEGLVFCGSHLGDSVLLSFSLERVDLPWNSGTSNSTTASDMDRLLALPSLVSDEEEKMLLKEEEELYGDAVVSDDDAASPSKKAKLNSFTRLVSLDTIDVLSNLGPLGKSILAPIAPPPAFLQDHVPEVVAGLEKEPVWGAQVLVQPCGFGSSGGIAIGAVPGRDDRLLRFEIDVLNVASIFSVRDLVFLCMGTGGFKVLRDDSQALQEVDLNGWIVKDRKKGSSSVEEISQGTLIQAAAFSSGPFVLIVRIGNEGSFVYRVLVMNESKGKVRKVNEGAIAEQRNVTSLTPMIKDPESENLVFAYTASDGTSEVVTVTPKGNVSTVDYSGAVDVECEAMDIDGVDTEEREVKEFYSSRKVVAADVFSVPVCTFDVPQGSDKSALPAVVEPDDDYDELYTTDNSGKSHFQSNVDSQSVSTLQDDVQQGVYVAICRQSGDLEVYALHGNPSKTPTFTSKGCGLGVNVLSASTEVRTPRFHKIHAKEVRFFYCGQSSSTFAEGICMAVMASSGDVSLYRRSPSTASGFCMERVRNKSVTRCGQEQTRHRTKLLRKKMAAAASVETFEFSRLFRFAGISGQDGLFVASTRPFWVCGERGRPTVLSHRTRHAAPAGGKPFPLSGFCCGGGLGEGYMTLHERVGRVGSQRLTVFNGLTGVFQSNGLLPGAGLCVEKIPLGVTVRNLHFIDNEDVSTAEHPLYLMLVSKEVDEDQGDLNDDGKTPEEREQQAREKEEEKIKRQVEADLGGFDLENEWVEEIERDDCFEIDASLGGAPPIRKESYAIWIVDSSQGWAVLDSFELEENEHGLTVNTMSLTEFPDEGTGGNAEQAVDEDNLPKRFFITLGTGILDHNGEDVASKGRAVLLEVKTVSHAGHLRAELSLRYEKPIYHGPVTTLVCLSSEGKNRLLIGAGADVNVEQWGNDRLTQVGFYRATMQVLDILQFKDFLLLSDAYDSLYFLIWRDSDKSLTLLAKDYDPIPVYAAGMMSRGPTLSFLCHDDLQNLQFFQYAPGEAAARGGNRLVCRADFHIGTQTTAFSSHLCRSSLLTHSATPTSTLAALKQQDSYFGRGEDDQRLGAYYGTSDGTMAAVIPLSEPVYWRLTALQSILAHALEGDCGLSPKAWRLYRRSFRRGGCRSNERKNGVIDGDLALQFADLSVADQEDVASSIGSTIGLILDNLLEVECASLVM